MSVGRVGVEIYPQRSGKKRACNEAASAAGCALGREERGKAEKLQSPAHNILNIMQAGVRKKCPCKRRLP